MEFADRRKLRCTMEEILSEILRLRGSFALGSALKEGIPVAIVGAPNVGKSTLLNRLLNEDRAMVSEIAGTTRDLIEEQTVIDGVRFRFIDTAGIRATNDRLERMGIERTRAGIARARIVVRLVDATTLGTGRLLPDRGCVQSAPHKFSHRGRQQYGSRRYPCKCCGGRHRGSHHTRNSSKRRSGQHRLNRRPRNKRHPCGGEPDRTRRNDSRHRP